MTTNVSNQDTWVIDSKAQQILQGWIQSPLDCLREKGVISLIAQYASGANLRQIIQDLGPVFKSLEDDLCGYSHPIPSMEAPFRRRFPGFKVAKTTQETDAERERAKAFLDLEIYPESFGGFVDPLLMVGHSVMRFIQRGGGETSHGILFMTEVTSGNNPFRFPRFHSFSPAWPLFLQEKPSGKLIYYSSVTAPYSELLKIRGVATSYYGTKITFSFGSHSDLRMRLEWSRSFAISRDDSKGIGISPIRLELNYPMPEHPELFSNYLMTHVRWMPILSRNINDRLTIKTSEFAIQWHFLTPRLDPTLGPDQHELDWDLNGSRQPQIDFLNRYLRHWKQENLVMTEEEYSAPLIPHELSSLTDTTNGKGGEESASPPQPLVSAVPLRRKRTFELLLEEGVRQLAHLAERVSSNVKAWSLSFPCCKKRKKSEPGP